MAEQINVNDFKSGITFLKNNSVFLVIEANHSKSGRGQAHVKVKVKNLVTGTINQITFIGGERVEKAFINKEKVQFLYSDEKRSYFMNNETFEQIEIENSFFVNKENNFLVEGLEVNITSYEGNILGIEIPKNVVIKILETTDAVKGDTVTNATKKAKLITGLEIDVPQFIGNGDEIIVNTETSKYVSRK